LVRFAPKNYYIIWISNLLTLRVSDKG